MYQGIRHLLTSEKYCALISLAVAAAAAFLAANARRGARGRGAAPAARSELKADSVTTPLSAVLFIARPKGIDRQSV